MVTEKSISKLLSEAEKKLVSDAIAAAEKKTSGEIVVQVVSRSDGYRANTALWLLSAWSLATLLYGILHWNAWFQDLRELLFFQILAMLVGQVLNQFSILARKTISVAEMQSKVHRQCMANFVALGLHDTYQHTGVLIFVSEFEHRVEILADSGIHKKVAPGYWDSEVHAIIEGIRQGNSAQALLAAIERIGNTLATHFPPLEGDKNELRNEVHVGDRALE